MAGYDPQARRARPALPTDSPVDGLLDDIDGPEVASEILHGSKIEPVVDSEEMEDDEGLLPFETPPVEMTDERADLVHRVGVLAAVAALVVVIVAVRRRRHL